MRQAARFNGSILLVVAALTACACGSGSSPTPAAAEFGVALSPSATSVQRGDSLAVTVLVTRSNGWSGPIDLVLSSAPTGVTAGALSIAQTATQGTLTLSVGPNVAPGAKMVQVLATSNGSTQLAILSLTVTVPSTGFALELSPSSATVQQGAVATVPVTLTRGSAFAAAVDVTITSAPAGVTADPLTIPAGVSQGVLTVHSAAATPVGSAAVQLHGSGGGQTATATLTLSVTAASAAQGFTLAVAPATVQQGATQMATATVTRATGFTAAVDVTITSGPAGVTADPLTIAAGASQGVLTISAAAAAAVGSATVQLLGSGGGQTATATLTLNVTAAPTGPGFTLAVDQPWVRVPKAGSGTVTVSVTREVGFTGAVALSATGLPPDVTVSGITIPAGANSALLTFNATAGALQRDVDVTVTGTNVLIVRTTTLEVLVPGAPGELDATFGGTGKKTFDISGSDYGRAVVVQPDGRILLAGSASSTSSLADFALLRVGRDGALDPMFGTGGKVLTALSGRDDVAYAILLQPDGKVLLAGSTTDPATSGKGFALARYDSTGALDTTFGQGGLVATWVTSGSGESRGVTIQTDGKIVVAGKVIIGTVSGFAIVRYTAAGVLDTSFGEGGAVLATLDPSPSAADWAEAVAMSGSNIVIVGRSQGQFAVVRFTGAGAADPTFGSAGAVTASFGLTDDFAYALAMSGDKPVVAGRVRVGGNTGFGVARFNANGTPDTTFSGTGGQAITQASTVGVGSVENEAYGVAIQADGKLVVAGYAEASDGNFDFALVRYDANGNLDSSFGNAGKVITNMNPTSARKSSIARGVALTRDGRIVLGGELLGDFAIARYWP